MIKIFEGDDVNSIVYQAMEKLQLDGIRQKSRNGEARFINDAEFILNNPRRRHLCLEGRTSNIFQMIAETLWVVAGQDNLYPYLTHFLPRAPLYSDDGLTWRGAYGNRLYKYDQLDGIVKTFMEDGVNTRRAVASIYDPQRDAPKQLAGTNPRGTRDVPCNLIMIFYTDEQGRFTARTIQRSGDVIFGAGSINLFEFSFIQEMMFSIIEQHVDPVMHLGPYRHSTVNLHVYDGLYAQMAAALDNKLEWIPSQDKYPMCFPDSVAKTRTLCADFINTIATPLLCAAMNLTDARGDLFKLMTSYGLPAGKNNQLFVYMELVLFYIATTRKYQPEQADYSTFKLLAPDLAHAVDKSTFRKFTITM